MVEADLGQGHAAGGTGQVQGHVNTVGQGLVTRGQGQDVDQNRVTGQSHIARDQGLGLRSQSLSKSLYYTIASLAKMHISGHEFHSSYHLAKWVVSRVSYNVEISNAFFLFLPNYVMGRKSRDCLKCVCPESVTFHCFTKRTYLSSAYNVLEVCSVIDQVFRIPLCSV